MRIWPIPIGEIAGSVGNFGTVFPLFFAVSLTTGMSLSLMLLICGIWYIITGLVYGIPIPVEPFKAVAAVAIAGQVSSEAVAASGIIIGILFLILGLTGGMERILHHIPVPVIRGIQLGLGLILMRSAIMDFGMQDTGFFIGCISIIILCFGARNYYGIPDFAALAILGVGIGVVTFTSGIPSPALPTMPYLVHPGSTDFMSAVTLLVLPQIPLTLANAVLATSLLATELYHRPVSANTLSKTIGVMGLSSSVIGGFPMCHGAGGVAAHHRFGARTGTAMIIGGIILIGSATMVTDPGILSIIPRGVFGALLLAVALELMIRAWRTDSRLIPVIMGGIAIPAGIVAAFIGGLILSALVQIYTRRFGIESSQEKR